tara:strand:- start:404 stop:1000 length:597 start_codon:yes stop_codon:yes gene_type:complete
LKKYLFIITSIIISSCASIYITNEGQEIANKHQSIAILSPTVGFENKKEVNSERTKSLEIQQEIYSWMLKRKSQGEITIQVQDIDDTNVILKRTGFSLENLTTNEICDLLEVDAVLYSNFNLSQPTSQGAAIVAKLLFNLNTATNKANASLSIKDCESKSMIWNYNHEFSGSLGSSSQDLVEGLMRHASKNLPYLKRK